MAKTAASSEPQGDMRSLHRRIGAWLEGDKVIWMVTLILSLCSLLAVYSAISSLAYKTDGSSLRFLFKQGTMLALGWGVMLLVHKVNFRYFSRISQVLIWVAAGLLLLTLLFGADINEAKRWLRIPFIGLTLQTSDFAKVVLVTFVARELNNRRMHLHQFKNGVLPILIPIGLICILILPADFSTAALLGMVCIGMLFIGGVPFRHMLKIAGLGVAALFMLYGLGKAAPDLLPRFGTWAGRLERFAGVGNASDGDALEYQIELAQVAINRGGILPQGPGTGTSRNFLPHPYSDMIYAFVIEEWGAIMGGLGLVLLYLILLYRTIRTATRCPRHFGGLLAMGLGFLLVLQAMINMAVAVRLFPTTGQPLPLVSYGGTSMVFTCLSIGMILAVSRSVAHPDQWENDRDNLGTKKPANRIVRNEANAAS
ncbi:FtsW/RodA/SpoVE family cell cycle protein [bacterium]|nr:FtsW/RodA/SpoVE family cell cycle protein [bacterium]MDC0854252.1 FtsW/RodA/SpoVE family cell cycle protein [Flavobacteriales bacterium]